MRVMTVCNPTRDLRPHGPETRCGKSTNLFSKSVNVLKQDIPHGRFSKINLAKQVLVSGRMSTVVDIQRPCLPRLKFYSEFERRLDHLVDTETGDPKVMPLVRLLWSRHRP